jgi:hypothetical protein
MADEMGWHGKSRRDEAGETQPASQMVPPSPEATREKSWGKVGLMALPRAMKGLSVASNDNEESVASRMRRPAGIMCGGEVANEEERGSCMC